MKVLHVIETLGIGGAEQMLVNLLPELERQGVTCSVAVVREPVTLKPILGSAGVEVVALPPHGKWAIAKGARNIASAANARGVDVIHAHLFFPSVYTAMARNWRLTRAQTCVTWHNLAYAPGCNKPGLSLRLRKTLNAYSVRRGMDGRIAVSQAVADHYSQELGVPPPVVIPNPIQISDLTTPPDESAGTLFVLPGRIVREKGHAIMVEALSILAARGMAFQAVFVGDGPLRQDVERRISDADLSGRVSIAGFLPHTDLLRVVARATVVAIPSLYEGFGMTAAEAMAAGRPVVATNVGGLAGIVEDGVSGLVVPPGDATALADALFRLANDRQLRQRFGAAGRIRISERFGASAVAAMIADYYRELTGGANGGPA